ncbi:MAG: hypothetical protein AAFX78_03415 [Cyanobacteria bacterium J06638_20]
MNKIFQNWMKGILRGELPSVEVVFCWDEWFDMPQLQIRGTWIASYAVLQQGVPRGSTTVIFFSSTSQRGMAETAVLLASPQHHIHYISAQQPDLAHQVGV